jgi:C-terminal processing protease CtpA/Prc
MSFTDVAIPMTKILRIRTFSSEALNSAGLDYHEFLESSFSQLKIEQTKNLIIDVRGNGGGNDHYGATLVSYIASSSFGYFNSIEVTNAYDGYGDIEEIAGKRYMLSHQDLAKQQPNKNRFAGKVFILADGGSFSTTADFVSISKNIGAATIVGLETGGGACGNTSGNSKSITLKNTGIAMRIQMWRYSSAIDKDIPCGHGVIPDYIVTDLPITDNDEVIEMVARLVAEG